MELMTEELQKNLPKLYDTEDTKIEDKIVYIRYYEINSGWQWFITEYSSSDRLCFGYVCGFENEWGYFSLEEMEQIDSIIRDEMFRPIKFSELNKSTEK
ncbi:MAG: hypothetical protein Q8M39_05005 [Sulfuricurvum sp.]|nr:hypothetical protein [Sulfuricurvum sp.]